MGENLHIGQPAPAFCLPDHDGKDVCLESFKGKWVVLYFYPRDNTPGCTIEAVDFSCIKDRFEELGAAILGVSPDSIQSHVKFIAKQDLSLTLLSDPEKKVIEIFGAWQLKKMYGKESYGVVRSTFLIDPVGKIAHYWPKVSAKGHAGEVLEKLKDLV